MGQSVKLGDNVLAIASGTGPGDGLGSSSSLNHGSCCRYCCSYSHCSASFNFTYDTLLYSCGNT